MKIDCFQTYRISEGSRTGLGRIPVLFILNDSVTGTQGLDVSTKLHAAGELPGETKDEIWVNFLRNLEYSIRWRLVSMWLINSS